tara:strand:- start:1045 stop:1809 length:765 start_codon:yes stop_codon:yes gene_type:complete
VNKKNEAGSGKKRVEKKPDPTSNLESQLYFSIIPEWIIDCDINAQAKLLYCILQRYADKETGRCWPAISTLGKRMRVSDSTVKRSLNELVSVGALVKESRYDKETGEQTSNLYTVIQVPPFMYDTAPSSPTTYKPKPLNQSQDIAKKIFVELCNAIGRKPITQSERGGWNKVVKELKEAGVKPNEIPDMVNVYKEYFKGMTLTPYAIAKHWALLKQVKEETLPKPPRDCEKEGHGYVDLDVIFKCRFCGDEKNQ